MPSFMMPPPYQYAQQPAIPSAPALPSYGPGTPGVSQLPSGGMQVGAPYGYENNPAMGLDSTMAPPAPSQAGVNPYGQTMLPSAPGGPMYPGPYDNYAK